MQPERFEKLLDDWGQGKYTPQELITHLMKHAKETAATINHHVRLMEVTEKRLEEAEQMLKEMKCEGGKQP